MVKLETVLACLQLPELYSTYNPPACSFRQLLHLVKDRIFRVASEKWIEPLNKPVMKNSEPGGKMKPTICLRLNSLLPVMSCPHLILGQGG